MTKPTVREHNIEIDEIIDREMTDAEFDFFTASKAEADARIVEAEAKAAEKTAVLEKLGLTAEEVAALLS